MSMKMMKKAMIGAIGGVAVLGAASAQAATNIYPTPTSPLKLYEFYGQTDLSVFGITVSCDLQLFGTVDYASPDGVEINVVDGNVIGSGNCGNVDLNLDPSDSSTWWYASDTGNPGLGHVSEGQLPNPRFGTTITGQFNNINVDVSIPFFPTINCSGSIPADFTNDANGTAAFGDPSAFTFNDTIGSSACDVDGQLRSEDANGNVDDVDAWES